MAGWPDRANAALGDRKRRLRAPPPCKLHAVHVNKIPAPVPCLGLGARTQGCVDAAPQINRQ